MTETQKRIKEYQSMLPGLKERVLAVALLLIVSLTMVTSTTFAWLTISRAPEVTGVSTTVAANGNLEIALATSKDVPGDSKVGDSSAAEGQSVTAANLTWGNLINLSDPSYGLDNLVLRPAQLNTTALLTSPLYGAVYSEDGRIERLTSNFSYTSWVEPTDVAEGYFGLANNLGVRAVSSTKREAVGVQGTILKLQDMALGANTTAGNTFMGIIKNPDWMDLLAKLMGIHMTATLNYEDKYINAVVTDEELGVLVQMYNEFIKAHEQEAEAISQMLNLQMYAAYGSDTSQYVEFTNAAVLAIAENDSRIVKTADASRGLEVGDFAFTTTDGSKTIRIRDLKTFIHDYNMLKADVVEIDRIKNEEGEAQWTKSGLKTLFNKLVKIDDCLIKKSSDSQYKTVKALMSEFTSGVSGAMSAMGYRGSTCDVVITNGVFLNFEKRTGGNIEIKKLKVSATMYVDTMSLGEVTADIYGNITTSASGLSDYQKDSDDAPKLYTGVSEGAGTIMAQDTYALAVDFWVRTNAASSFLTLEGNVLYDDGREEVVMGKDANGNPVELYTLNRITTVTGDDGSASAVTKNYTLYPITVAEDEAKPNAYYSAEADSLGEYVSLSDSDVQTLTATGKTVTGKDGQTYNVYALSREESRYQETSYTLYKVETDGSTIWYTDADDVEFALNSGEVPTETDRTTEKGSGKLYTLTRSTTYAEIVNYELYSKEIDAVWYNSETYSVFGLNDGETPTLKVETIYTIIGYEGENRVWNGEDKSYISADATTQGSGSCYVYYADTPEDQARSLELLASMNVAFIGYITDIEGNEKGVLLAEAKMDTQRHYAEAGGRVTVPLKLTSGAVLGEDENTGDIIYGITDLVKNEPTRITALVYLDGTVLGNENVLAASDIQGRLNIQFGSSLELHPIDNEDLENDELRVSATVDKTSFDYDTHQGGMKVKVTVNVDGDAPSNITGFFLRQISSTQGSREEEMTFTKQADGTWAAEYTFDAPGVYILRSVRLDGVDYDLGTIPTVTITGFNVASLTCNEAGENNRINIMTAANSSTVNLNLKFVTDDPDKMPRTVQGRFLREDGTAVNVNFTYNPTTQIWKGAGTFLSSGDYTLEYLVLDGKHTALDEALHHTAHVTLGMRVAVYTTSPLSFKYLPSEMTDNQKLLAMQVKIMDNTGKEMEGLQGVKLVYNMKGSGVTKMDTDLRWDGGKGYYIGDLKAGESGGPGVWVFGNVTVSGNTLTNATTAPTFTLISPEPPSFDKIATKVSYQFKPNGDAYMEADLNYSATARVFAVINGIEVEGRDPVTTGNVTSWKFTVPLNTSGTWNGKQDGYWTMEELRIWDYYTADGEYIAYEKEDGTSDEPMVIDMASQDYTVKVVQTVKVTFAANQSKDFNGAFMQSHTISGLNVEISDFEGAALQNVTEIKLEYIYQNDSQDKGSYSHSSITNALADFTIALTDDGSHTKFVQSGSQAVRYAGTYIPKFSFRVNSLEYSYGDGKSTSGLPSNAPVFTASSATPTVTITAITPTEGVAVSVDATTAETTADTSTEIGRVENGNTGGCNPQTAYDFTWSCTTHASHISAGTNQHIPTISPDGRTATVYFICSHPFHAGESYDGGTSHGSASNPGTPSNIKYHQYEYNGGNGVPSVTLMASGLGEATNATLTFTPSSGTDVMMFTQYTKDNNRDTYWANRGNNSATKTNSYVWTSDNSNCMRFIGGMDNEDDRGDNDVKYVAGTITADTLILSYDINGDGTAETISFAIETITINNPY